MEDLKESEIVKELIKVFDEKLKKIELFQEDSNEKLKNIHPKGRLKEPIRDTGKPESWPSFVAMLNPTGVMKLILQHCAIETWDFPCIVLTLQTAQEMFLTPERITEVGRLFERYYGSAVNVLILSKNGKKGIYEIMSAVLTMERMQPGRYTTKCPFHEENTPSLIVDVYKQTYRCLSCGVAGNSDHFQQEYDLECIAQDVMHGRREFKLDDETIAAFKRKIFNLLKENELKIDTITKLSEKIDINNCFIKTLLGDKNPYGV